MSQPKTTATIIDFAKAARNAARRFESLGHGLYRRKGKFYERPRIHGKQTWRVLQSVTERRARIEMGKNKSDHALATIGRAIDPYSKNHAATVASICDFYIKHNCPRRNGEPRDGKKLEYENWIVENLKSFFNQKLANTVTHEDLADYHKWRTARTKRGAGHRQVDIELVTLSNIYRFAVRNARKTGVTTNPIGSDREKYSKPNTVRHCRQCQPENGDELHALANYLFNDPHSEVLGWQLLFEAMIGHRTKEILQLRTDAKKAYEPGFLQKHKCAPPSIPRQVELGKTSLLYLYNSDSAKGTYPFVMIHRALNECLKAHANWKVRRFSESPWFFPSRKNQKNHVDKHSLTRALARITPAMGLPHRTSHGMRSYFVNVLRSNGVPDFEIALMVGQKTGGREIVDVYGKIPAGKLTWVPVKNHPPAWNKWL